MAKNKGKKEISSKSGIVVVNKFDLKNDFNKAETIFAKIAKILFVVLVTVSTLYNFVECFGLKFSYIKTLIAIMFFTVVWYKVFSLKKKNIRIWLTIGTSSIYAIIFVVNRKKISEGFFALLGRYLEEFNNYFGEDLGLINSFSGNEKDCVTELIIIASMFITMILTSLIVNYTSRFFYIIVTLPFFILCFFVGINPNGGYFIMYIVLSLTFFSVSVVNSKDYLKDRFVREIASVKLGITFMMVVLIGVALVCIIYSKKKFKDEKGLENVKYVTQSTITDIENRIYKFATGRENPYLNTKGVAGSIISGSAGGISYGKISYSDSIKYRNVKRLHISLKEKPENAIYLKSFVGSEYDKGWSKYNGDMVNDDDEKYLNSIVTNVMLGKPTNKYFKKNVISIEKKRKELTLPYMIELNASVKINEDGLSDGTYTEITNEDLTDCRFLECNFDNLKMNYEKENLMPMLNSIEDEISLMDNGDVRNIFEDNSAFKEVPEKLQQGVVYSMQNCSVRPGEIEDEEDKEEKIKKIIEVVDYIRENYEENYEYTLTPDMPKVDDAIEYFLTTGKKGFCMHFAGAATAMLRYEGIPTRYVEGYIVEKSDIVGEKENKEENEMSYKVVEDLSDDGSRYEVDVMDTSAHAWVEVFIEGLGWIPVEVTYSKNESYSQDERENTQDENIENTIKQDDKDEIQQKQDNKDEIEQKQINKDTTKTKQANKKEKTNKKAKCNVKVVVSIGMIIILVGGVCVFIRYNKKRKAKDRQQISKSQEELMKYVSINIKKILLKKNIKYSSNGTYDEYAKKIAKGYNLDEENIKKYVSITLKENFSEEGISSEESLVLKKYYSSFMDYYYKDLNILQKLYFDNICRTLRNI